MTRIWIASAALFLSVMMTGCPHDEFLITMTPRDGRMERRITGWRADIGEDNREERLKEEILATWEELYEKRLSPPDQIRQSFSGSFAHTMPGDLWSAGRYYYWPTTLGSASLYVERFCGNENQATVVNEGMSNTDKFVDMLIGWFEQELGQEPNFMQLRSFMDNQLRHDLKTLGVYAYVENTLPVLLPSSRTSDVVAMQATLYLIEHGYLAGPEDLWQLEHEETQILHKLEGLSEKWLTRLMATKLGVPVDQPIPHALDFLADNKKLEASFDRYIAGTEAYRSALEKWEMGNRNAPEKERPEPMELYMDGQSMGPLLLVFGYASPESPGHLSISLATGIEPWTTNGRWNPENGTVDWDRGLPADPSWPLLATARWSQPDEAFQKAHLGRVAVMGGELSDYGMWRQSLTEQEGREWDSLLVHLNPGPELPEQLKAFRFSDEPREPRGEEKEPPPSRAKDAIDAILSALGSRGV